MWELGSRGWKFYQTVTRAPMVVPDGPNQRWSLDFVSDAFTDSRRFRILCVIDDFSRECLALLADTSLSGARVARELDLIIARRGKPKTIVSDNRCPAGDACIPERGHRADQHGDPAMVTRPSH